MKRILNFVRLDFYTLKQICFVLLAAAVANVALYVIIQDNYLAMMLMALLAPCSFLFAENNNMDMLYATLPITRRDFVLGRYTSAMLMMFLVGLVPLLALLLLSAIVPLTVSTSNLVGNIIANFFGGCMLAALQYPFFFLFSYLKARILSILPPLAICLLLLLCGDMIAAAINSNPLMAAVAAVIGGLLLMSVSCEISSRIFNKRNL